MRRGAERTGFQARKGTVQIVELDLIFKIAGVGIIVSVLSILLKKADRDEYAMIVTIAGLIVVLAMIINEIAALFETIKTVFGF